MPWEVLAQDGAGGCLDHKSWHCYCITKKKFKKLGDIVLMRDERIVKVGSKMSLFAENVSGFFLASETSPAESGVQHVSAISNFFLVAIL